MVIRFFLQFWLVEKFCKKKNFFLADFDNTTEVNRIFLTSVFIGLSIQTSKKSNKWISFFSNSDWSKNFEEKKKFFLANFDNTTKVNRIFLVSVFIGLSIPMSKKSNNGIRFFLQFWLVEKFCRKKNFFLADFDNTTKVNRIFLASVFIGLSNRTSKKSNKWISFFSNSDWSKNFVKKKNFFSRISTIQQRSIEFF